MNQTLTELAQGVTCPVRPGFSPSFEFNQRYFFLFELQVSDQSLSPKWEMLGHESETPPLRGSRTGSATHSQMSPAGTRPASARNPFATPRLSRRTSDEKVHRAYSYFPSSASGFAPRMRKKYKSEQLTQSEKAQ